MSRSESQGQLVGSGSAPSTMQRRPPATFAPALAGLGSSSRSAGAGEAGPRLCMGQHGGIGRSSGGRPAAAPQDAFPVGADVKTSPARVTQPKQPFGSKTRVSMWYVRCSLNVSTRGHWNTDTQSCFGGEGRAKSRLCCKSSRGWLRGAADWKPEGAGELGWSRPTQPPRGTGVLADEAHGVTAGPWSAGSEEPGVSARCPTAPCFQKENVESSWGRKSKYHQHEDCATPRPTRTKCKVSSWDGTPSKHDRRARSCQHPLSAPPCSKPARLLP